MSSRIQNTKRNILASYMLMGLQIIFQFVSRSVIVHSLGEEYLGLSSLYTSILQVLNVAESGFSVSIVYFMYKPLAYGNVDEVCALLSFMKRIYRYVGTIILCLGIIIIPFLKLIIKGSVPEDVNIYILYVLYLLNTSVGYFLFAYKTSLLTALQRLDLTKITNCIVMVVQYSFQIISLVCFHNYYLFVISMVLGTALVNVFNNLISIKKFPEYVCAGELSKNTKREIWKKVKGLLVCNISGVTYTTFDSITISAFVGLNSVAIYNNYLTIENAVASIIILIRTAMQASVGNSVAVESVEKNREDIGFWQFLFSGLAIWCATCMICLFQPFMKLWMGKGMLLPFVDVILLGVWFVLTVVQQAFHLYLGGAGLWNEMKLIYILSTGFNLIMNVLLGKIGGITGIILATVLSSIIFGVFGQCIIIFKCYFHASSRKYIFRQFSYFIISGLVVCITYFACSFVKLNGIKELIVKSLICLILPTILLIILSIRTKYLSRTKKIIFAMKKL